MGNEFLCPRNAAALGIGRLSFRVGAANRGAFLVVKVSARDETQCFRADRIRSERFDGSSHRC